MNEVYWGCYRFDPAAACVPIVLAPEAVSPQDRVEVVAGAVLFAGNGIPATRRCKHGSRLRDCGTFRTSTRGPMPLRGWVRKCCSGVTGSMPQRPFRVYP